MPLDTLWVAHKHTSRPQRSVVYREQMKTHILFPCNRNKAKPIHVVLSGAFRPLKHSMSCALLSICVHRVQLRIYFPRFVDGDDIISRFYKDAVIFITGGTGFLGKILVEKLLRSFVVKRIYLLVRVKNNLTVNERLAQFFEESVRADHASCRIESTLRLLLLYCFRCLINCEMSCRNNLPK